jgi:hypothetical protein
MTLFSKTKAVIFLTSKRKVLIVTRLYLLQGVLLPPLVQ